MSGAYCTFSAHRRESSSNEECYAISRRWHFLLLMAHSGNGTLWLRCLTFGYDRDLRRVDRAHRVLRSARNLVGADAFGIELRFFNSYRHFSPTEGSFRAGDSFPVRVPAPQPRCPRRTSGAPPSFENAAALPPTSSARSGSNRPLERNPVTHLGGIQGTYFSLLCCVYGFISRPRRGLQIGNKL
jgi:hypothetical protein